MIMCLLLPAICLAPATLAAQGGDRCGDILVNGVFGDTRFHSNTYVQQLAYSRFASSSYDSTTRNLSGAANIPAGKIMIGGSFSKEDHALRKRQLEKENLFQFTSKQEVDVAMHVADEKITESWLGCMRLRGGLIVTSQLVTPKVATISLSWATPPNSGLNATKLVEFGVLPAKGIEISTGKHCVEQGRVINSQVCLISFQMPNATDAVVVSIQTDNGAQTVYIPARMKLEETTKRLSDTTGKVAARPNTRRPKVLTLDLGNDVNEGWMFDYYTIRPEVQRLAENCRQESAVIALDRVSVTWVLDSNSGNSAECRMSLTAQAKRLRWVPMY